MVKVLSTTQIAAAEIVEVLHKNKIPLALIPTVYDKVEQLIQAHTVPCVLPVSFPEGKEDPRMVAPPTPWPGSSEKCTLSFAGTGAHRHSYPEAQSFSSSDFGSHTHSFKTDWKPNPDDYLADKDSTLSNTLNDPANNNS